MVGGKSNLISDLQFDSVQPQFTTSQNTFPNKYQFNWIIRTDHKDITYIPNWLSDKAVKFSLLIKLVKKLSIYRNQQISLNRWLPAFTPCWWAHNIRRQSGCIYVFINAATCVFNFPFIFSSFHQFHRKLQNHIT